MGGCAGSEEERSAAISAQSKSCRMFCGREDLRIRCEPGDGECVAMKRKMAQQGIQD